MHLLALVGACDFLSCQACSAWGIHRFDGVEMKTSFARQRSPFNKEQDLYFSKSWSSPLQRTALQRMSSSLKKPFYRPCYPMLSSNTKQQGRNSQWIPHALHAWQLKKSHAPTSASRCIPSVNFFFSPGGGVLPEILLGSEWKKAIQKKHFLPVMVKSMLVSHCHFKQFPQAISSSNSLPLVNSNTPVP